MQTTASSRTATMQGIVSVYVPSDERIESLRFQRFIKRLIDVLVSLVLLVVLSPILALISLVVKLSNSQAPILYKWEAVGKNGYAIEYYKFRTMVSAANEIKETLLSANEMNGPVFKMKNDPRVTPVGRILRKFSLDELPQLWTVLKGDMSLVGPRPVGRNEWEGFENGQRRKLSVIPGGICLWQVRGKPKDFNVWIKLDLEYIDTWSLWLDIKILFDGIWYVLSGRNY